jgi:DNA polymerase III gamma/tau subunit
LLQIRCWKSTLKNWYRSRWRWAQISQRKNERQEKSRKIEEIRVESISSYKQPSRQQLFKNYLSIEEVNQEWTYLYDLEVENEHCYFAENILVHNCHSLSIKAWESLLKSIEEPPEHVYWIFCSTNPSKIPDTIKTRCVKYTLKPVDELEIFELLERISAKEKLDTLPEVLEAIAEGASGSPRQALTNLELCAHAKSGNEARNLMRSALQMKGPVDLARLLLSNRKPQWIEVTRLINSMENVEAETIRIVVCNYIAGALIKAKSNDEARRFLAILEGFGTPYQSSDKLAPLLLSVGLALGLDTEK